MPRKKKKIGLSEKIFLLKRAGIKTPMPTEAVNTDKLATLPNRIAAILELNEITKKDKSKMLFFVMYDIEDNKVRKEIAKFLIRNSCVRIQKSVYFCSASHETFNYISTTLKEVQEAYDNFDSIIIVPVDTDFIKTMKLIGKNIDFDIITGNTNTLIF